MSSREPPGDQPGHTRPTTEPPDQSPEGRVVDMALVAAHQLKSPLGGIQTTLNLLLGGFAGPVSPKQRELLESVHRRAGKGMELVSDLLRLRSVADLALGDRVPVQADKLLRETIDRLREQAEEGEVNLIEGENLRDAWVMADPGVLAEVFFALLENAVKYTPRGGEVTASLTRPSADTVSVKILDTGIGIPPEAVEQVFQVFYRAPNAVAMSREGTGLGLAFAAGAVERMGGELEVGPGERGGTRAVVSLQAADVPTDPSRAEPEEPQASQRVVVVGGVTAGSKAAARIMRLDPDAHVTIVERGRFLSYAGCGLPYYISGAVREQRDLLSTPLGDVRDSSFFHNLKNVRTLDLTEAVAIHREEKVVTVRRLVDGEERRLPYDKLVLATGARALVPPMKNNHLDRIHTLHGVEDAEAIREELRASSAKDVVIVGGGILGCEIAESVSLRGARIHLVEAQEHLLGIVDGDLAALVERHLESQGVKVHLGSQVTGFRGDDHVQEVVLANGRRFPCDFVILATGVTPDTALARDAGLDLGLRGAIRTDDRQRTSDPTIFAVGDCAETRHLVTGLPAWVPMGSTALKQGRVAAAGVAGEMETFPGVMGTILLKVFDFTVARTGLSTEEARAAGFDPISVTLTGPDKAHYLPTASTIYFRLVADRRSRRILGAQCVGPGDAAPRVDVVTTALMGNLTLDMAPQLDLGFAPAYSMPMDMVITAANVARNRLDGIFHAISAADLHRALQEDQPPLLLDVRLPVEFRSRRLPGSMHVPLGALRGRLHEIPRRKPVVVVCNSGLRAYEAALLLQHRGFSRVKALDGGLDTWPWFVEEL